MGLQNIRHQEQWGSRSLGKEHLGPSPPTATLSTRRVPSQPHHPLLYTTPLLDSTHRRGLNLVSSGSSSTASASPSASSVSSAWLGAPSSRNLLGPKSCFLAYLLSLVVCS